MIRIHTKGDWYWGVEKHSTSSDWRLLAPAFLIESSPPYRTSTKARRVRILHKELHVGKFVYGTDPERLQPLEASDSVVVEAWNDLGWDMGFDVEEWRTQRAQEQAARHSGT